MTKKPTRHEIEDVIAGIQQTRDTWRGNPVYTRCLDIELHALRLLLCITRIENEETDIAASLRSGADG